MARHLRLFYLFRLLSTSYLFVPVQVFFAKSRGLSDVEFGTLMSIYALVVIFTEVPTGMISDRLGRRRAMMVGAASMVAACATFAMADSFAGFALGQALAALSMTFCSGADSAYLFDLLHDHGVGHEYPRREGTASAWHQAGNTLAFAAGGLLATVDLVLPYLATAGVATVAFFVAFSMRKDRPRSDVPLGARECVDHMKASFRLVLRRRQLAWVIGYSAVIFTLLRSTEFMHASYLRSTGFGVLGVGLVFAAMYAGAAAIAQHADLLRRRFSEATLLWSLPILLTVTYFVLGQFTGGVAMVALALQALPNGLYSPLVKPLIQRQIDDSGRRATVLSVESMVRRGAFFVLSPMIGFFVESYSTGAGLMVCASFGVIGMAVLAATVPRELTEKTPPPAPAPAAAGPLIAPRDPRS